MTGQAFPLVKSPSSIVEIFSLCRLAIAQPDGKLFFLPELGCPVFQRSHPSLSDSAFLSWRCDHYGLTTQEIASCAFSFGTDDTYEFWKNCSRRSHH
jgi:hypothetical protein